MTSSMYHIAGSGRTGISLALKAPYQIFWASSYRINHNHVDILVFTVVIVGDVVVSVVVVVFADVFINVVVVIVVLLLLLLLSLAQRMLLWRLLFSSGIGVREIEQLRQSAQHQVYADKVWRKNTPTKSELAVTDLALRGARAV